MPVKRKTKAAAPKKKVTKVSSTKGKKSKKPSKPATKTKTKTTGIEPEIVPGVLPR